MLDTGHTIINKTQSHLTESYTNKKLKVIYITERGTKKSFSHLKMRTPSAKKEELTVQKS